MRLLADNDCKFEFIIGLVVTHENVELLIELNVKFRRVVSGGKGLGEVMRDFGRVRD